MIKGKRVALRMIQRRDFSLICKWLNDSEVLKFWGGRDKCRSMGWVEKLYQPMVEGKSWIKCWMIEVKNRPIGFIYNNPDTDEEGSFSGGVGLDILIGEKSKWGEGYGVEALEAMLDHAFNEQNAERVFIIPRVANARALHVFEKVGFKKEGILRHFKKFEGKWSDYLMMSILKNEFKQKIALKAKND
jgi:ribosomal-protein-alanine N-acetyltransferase